MTERCSYCGRPLRSKYSFSYGIPGVRQTCKCDRWWCFLASIRVRWLWGDDDAVSSGYPRPVPVGIYWDGNTHEFCFFGLRVGPYLKWEATDRRRAKAAAQAMRAALRAGAKENCNGT